MQLRESPVPVSCNKPRFNLTDVRIQEALNSITPTGCSRENYATETKKSNSDVNEESRTAWIRKKELTLFLGGDWPGFRSGGRSIP